MAAILVVDDEPLIREMLARILEREGFAAICAADGVQALHKYHLHKVDIELVISDCSMPKLDGPTLAALLLKEQSDLPIILMSEGCEGIDIGSSPTFRFLPKPFDLAE